MANAARGEVDLKVGGQSYSLCLTMGALAEIETALGADSLNALDDRLRNPRGEDLIAILHALLKGGGEALSLEDVRALPMQVADVSQAIGAAFTAAGAKGPAPRSS